MDVWAIVGIVIAIIIVLIILFAGIRIVRPTQRGLVERLGKYNRYSEPGFHLIIPIVERMFKVDIREMMVEATPQMIITNDNLNAQVDAQVYLKVKADEESVKASQYNVTNYQYQIVNLARTTLRNIIGTLTLKSANSERGKINAELRQTLLHGDGQLGHRDPPHRTQGDRSARGRAGDHEQGGQGGEREGRRHRLRHRHRDPGRRSAPRRDQEGRGHQAGPDPPGRRRSAGHPAGQRSRRQVLRRQRPDPTQAGGGGEGPGPERQGRGPRRQPS